MCSKYPISDRYFNRKYYGLLMFCPRYSYSTIGELSSKCDEFLALRSQFDSDYGVHFSAPTCCQSATLVRPLFTFYCPLFFMKKIIIMRHFATGAMFTLRD